MKNEGDRSMKKFLEDISIDQGRGQWLSAAHSPAYAHSLYTIWYACIIPWDQQQHTDGRELREVGGADRCFSSDG